MKILTLILAGGTGTELSVLTRRRAKTAVPFGGRYRIIDFCLSNCVHSGLQEIAVLAQYSPKSIVDHIGMGKPWDLDRRSGGIYILQPSHNGEAAQWYLGTADALYQNVDLIRNSRAEEILVLSGDQVYMMDYRPMIEHHRSARTAATIATKRVQASERSRFGMVRCSRGGRVTAFKEKPTKSTYRSASLGIYLFRREFLLDTLGSGKRDIVFDIIMPLIKRGELAAYEFNGYWEDIGSIASYYRASLELLKNRQLITDPDRPIYTQGSGLPPARCAKDARVSDSIIADGCIVKGAVTGSILFPGVTVEAGAVVENSIIFSSCRIGSEARVSRSIIDKSVTVGGGSSVGARVRRERIPSSGDDAGGIAVLGAGVRVSPKAVVQAGALIEPNTIVESRRRGS